jgi:hypothetical protein
VSAPATVVIWDPILSEEEAAEYCGRVSTKTLERMMIPRTPLPGRGKKRIRHGYRLSDLNAFLAKLADPKARGILKVETTVAEADRLIKFQRDGVAARRQMADQRRAQDSEAQSA